MQACEDKQLCVIFGVHRASEGEFLPELGWGSMRLSVGRQAVRKAGES